MPLAPGTQLGLGIELCAKSFILQVYDVLARHSFKDVLTAVSFQKCAASLPCVSIFLPVSCLFISSARLEAKMRRFDGCVGYAQPIHTLTISARLHLDLESDGREFHRQNLN
jgi:hypothetical protein